MRVTKDQALNNMTPEPGAKPAIEVQPPRKFHAAV
jgi:hypothetical protein